MVPVIGSKSSKKEIEILEKILLNPTNYIATNMNYPQYRSLIKKNYLQDMLILDHFV